MSAEATLERSSVLTQREAILERSSVLEQSHAALQRSSVLEQRVALLTLLCFPCVAFRALCSALPLQVHRKLYSPQPKCGPVHTGPLTVHGPDRLCQISDSVHRFPRILAQTHGMYCYWGKGGGDHPIAKRPSVLEQREAALWKLRSL